MDRPQPRRRSARLARQDPADDEPSRAEERPQSPRPVYVNNTNGGGPEIRYAPPNANPNRKIWFDGWLGDGIQSIGYVEDKNRTLHAMWLLVWRVHGVHVVMQRRWWCGVLSVCSQCEPLGRGQCLIPFSLSLSLHRYVVVRLLFRISCNIFYPTIEVEGWENLPDEGEGTILCFNHNNGLGDPTVRRSRRGRTREIPTLAVCCAAVRGALCVLFVVVTKGCIRGIRRLQRLSTFIWLD